MVSRFVVPPDQAETFAVQAREAIATLAQCAGFVDAALGQSTDDPQLRTIATRWQSIGAYRRSLSNYDVKLTAIPLLSTAVDEPSAFELVHVRDVDSAHDAVSGLAADAGETRLGHAASPSVERVVT